MGFDMTPATKGIAGHEGAGVVVAVGDDMHHKWKIGDRAGIKWIWSICGECEFCLNGEDELHCVNQKNSGVTAAGTFQQYALADGKYTTRIPEGVPDEEAGPIMCGGVTANTACKRSGVRPGQWVVISGGGGGLGHFAVQYAKAMVKLPPILNPKVNVSQGMRVIAIDGSDEKGALAMKLGAEHFMNFRETKDLEGEVKRITKYSAHGVIVTAASKQAYETAPSLLRPNGTVVAVGLPHDANAIAGAQPLTMVLNRLKIVGSVVGSSMDVDEALDFTARGLVHVSSNVQISEDPGTLTQRQ